jgi:hypothetical protein
MMSPAALRGWVSGAVVVAVSVTLLLETALAEEVASLLLFALCVAAF